MTFLFRRELLVPGRHVTNRQMSLFMQFRQTDTAAVAATNTSFSVATGYRLAADPRLPAMRMSRPGRRRPDLFEVEVVPMRKVDGWTSLATPITDQPVALAA